MEIISKSKAHVEAVEESYIEHMGFAFKYAFCCFKAGFAALLHGLCPALFVTTASEIISKLNGRVDKGCRDLKDV